MPFHRAVDDVIVEIGNAGDRGRYFDAVVERDGPPTVSATARPAGRSETRLVDVRSRFEVIQGANAVPGFDAGGRVAARIPPPHSFTMGAVVEAKNLAELQ